MTKRISHSIFLAALSALLVLLAGSITVFYVQHAQLQQDRLQAQVRLAAQSVSQEGMGYFSALQPPESQMIWVDASASVRYCSEGNHLSPENPLLWEPIQAAFRQGIGEASQYSSTLLERSVVCAVKLPDGSVLCVLNTMDSPLALLLDMSGYLCLVLGLALLLSWFLASRLSRRIAAPLMDPELDASVDSPRYKELVPLLRRIDSQQQLLRSQSWTLQRKQNEWDTVTGSMSEGLVLLNSSCVILTVNAAARRLLQLAPDCVGSDILSYSKDLSDLLLTALNGERSEKLLPLDGGSYQVDASPVFSEETVSGVVLLLFDVTEKHKAEQQRREFTANISHELKTPLHSISGYAELLSHGLVQPEDSPSFYRKIYNEAQRMIRLVEDIIRLSQLDEGEVSAENVDVDLLQLAQDILDSLKPEAELAGIALHLKGHPLIVRSIPHLLRGLLRNLCDNAIKYNRPGGTVIVTLGTEGGHPWISVEDTGIGIPREHHQRIFERFYRVDKSHSKAVGGTGLGLSIVKHAAIALGAQLELDSEPGIGTTITVRLPGSALG